MLLTTKRNVLAWVQGISLRSKTRWPEFVKIQTGSGSNSLRVFGGIECRGFHTTFSIASQVQRLKCLSSRPIGGGPVIGWVGFNGSFRRMAIGVFQDRCRLVDAAQEYQYNGRGELG